MKEYPAYVVAPEPGMVVRRHNGMRRVIAVDGGKVLFETLATRREHLTTYNQWVQWAFGGVLATEAEVEKREEARRERAEFLRELQVASL